MITRPSQLNRGQRFAAPAGCSHVEAIRLARQELRERRASERMTIAAIVCLVAGVALASALILGDLVEAGVIHF